MKCHTTSSKELILRNTTQILSNIVNATCFGPVDRHKAFKNTKIEIIGTHANECFGFCES